MTELRVLTTMKTMRFYILLTKDTVLMLEEHGQIVGKKVIAHQRVAQGSLLLSTPSI